MPAQDLRTANFDLPLIDDEHELEASRLRLNEAVTTISLRLQEIVNQTQSPDAGTLGGQDLSFVLSLANAIGILPVSKGGTGATDATGARAALGIDAAWDVKFAAALNVAPEQLNTILEIVAEIQDNDSAIAAINTVLASKAAQTALDAVETRVTTAEAELDVVLPGGASGPFRYPPMTTTEINAVTGMSNGDKVRNTTEDEDWEYDTTDGWGAVSGGALVSGDVVVGTKITGGKIKYVKQTKLDFSVLPATASHSGIALIPNTTRLVFDRGNADQNACYELDLSDMSYTAVGDTTYSGYKKKMIGVSTGKVVCFGDRSTGKTNLCIYDPDAQTWSAGAAIPNGTTFMNNPILLPNGHVFACGFSASAACYAYDPAGDSWATLASSPGVTEGGMSILASNGKVYVAYNTILYEYDPVGDSWATKTAPPATLGIGGGNDGAWPALIDYKDPTKLDFLGYIYDPATDTWEDRSYDWLGLAASGFWNPKTVHGGVAYIENLNGLICIGDIISTSGILDVELLIRELFVEIA